MLTSAALLASQLVVALVFGYAAIAKLRRPAPLTTTLEVLISHRAVATLIAASVIVCELLTSALAVTGGVRLRAAGLLALILLATFAGTGVYVLARGLKVACACFGRKTGLLGATTLVRSVLLSIPASWLLYTWPASDVTVPVMLIGLLMATAGAGLSLLLLRATDVFFTPSGEDRWREVVG